jgi:hypothetical protein
LRDVDVAAKRLKELIDQLDVARAAASRRRSGRPRRPRLRFTPGIIRLKAKRPKLAARKSQKPPE